MADDLANEKSSLSPGQAQHVDASLFQTIEISQWDRLLAKLGLTEREALNAIVLDSDVGRSIRRFVQDSASAHFVPEDVLLAVDLQRKALFYADES